MACISPDPLDPSPSSPSSVSSLLKELPPQISRVEAEIVRVEQEIRDSMAANDREREMKLRDKEKQLRDEKLFYLHRGPPKGSLLFYAIFLFIFWKEKS